MPHDFDLFVIGAGSGGVRAARVAAGYGARVGIAEEHKVGGTCVIRGCVPKKLLVYGSHFAEDLVDARRFGWDLPSRGFDWPTLRDNVLAEVDRLNGIYETTLSSHDVALHRGRAELVDAHTIRLSSADGDRTVTADKVLIATGARPLVPKLPGAELGITSNEVFHLEHLPKSVVIAGGGYIANEFAGIFHELGVKVTLINRTDVILRQYEAALRDRLMQISTMKGIRFVLNCEPTGVERTDGGIRLTRKGDDPLDADLLLWAVGRRPNVEGLGLEAAGVALTEKHAIAVDAESRTNVDTIWAVGDVTDRVQLTPVAIREGQAFADTVFGNKPWTVDHSCIPSAVFSNPPIASVGLTEAAAKNKLGQVRIYASDFRPMKNVLAGRNERSLYKLVVDDASDVVVGAHMIGPDAPEILQALAIAVKAKLTKAQFDQTVALHPTMAEELVLMR
ncbi:MAG: glutathione-disulfide reductase [Sphingomonadaceae bacterium]|nr:glutathione-disulfide reductase [Sphingomonadaceae bacterium]